MAKPAIEISLSKEIKQMMDPAAVKKMLVKTNLEAGKYLLGLSNEQMRSKSIPPGSSTRANAPLTKSFAPWSGRGNQHTTKFDEYTQEYEDKKQEEGSNNYLVLSGELYKDAVLNADVFANLNKIVITARKGRSKKYAGAQQYGSKSVPPRPFYMLTNQDEKQLAQFMVKRLLRIFNKG